MMADTDRVVVITGGSKGIGREIALRFVEDKARIVVVHYDPDESAAEETLNILAEEGIEAESHRVDISSYDDAGVLFKEILSKFGKVDVLVNNAGITKDGLLMRMSEDDWDRVMQVNLKSVLEDGVFHFIWRKLRTSQYSKMENLIQTMIRMSQKRLLKLRGPRQQELRLREYQERGVIPIMMI